METTPITSPDTQVHTENLASRKQVVVFMGPEGSGKSSMAERLSGKYSLPFLTYGDVFRGAARRNETQDEKRCKELMESGRYMDLDLVQRLIANELADPKYERGIVIDGALRVPGEVESFLEMLQSAGFAGADITVFYLRVPGWQGFQRILDGNRNRKDDSVEGIQDRLGNFYRGLGQRATELKKLESRDKLEFIIVNGTGSKDEVEKEIEEKFKSKN